MLRAPDGTYCSVLIRYLFFILTNRILLQISLCFSFYSVLSFFRSTLVGLCVPSSCEGLCLPSPCCRSCLVYLLRPLLTDVREAQPSSVMNTSHLSPGGLWESFSGTDPGLGWVSHCATQTSFRKCCQIVFQNDCTCLPFHQWCSGVSVSPCPSQHLVLSAVSEGCL